MFLKPEDLENVRVSSLLSLVANTGLGLVSLTSRTGEETQWNNTDLGIVRVRYGTPCLIYYYYYYYYYYGKAEKFIKGFGEKP
jgi:hypothetical protein